MFRLGIIGCGRIVEEGHVGALRLLREEGLLEVLALADPVAERRALVGERLDVAAKHRYGEHRQMLVAEKLDVVDVAVPHFLHAPIVLDCARARVHIISEKPLATNLREVDRMLSACARYRVRLGVLHNYRYTGRMTTALALIKKKVLGRVFLVRSEGLGGGHWPGARGYDPDWRTKRSRAGGGCLIDNAYHNIYLAREMMASPLVSVFARVETYTRKIDVDDTAIVLFNFDNGGVASIQVSWGVSAGGRGVNEVHGTKGSLSFTVPDHDHPVGLFDNARGEWTYPQVTEPAGGSFAAIFREILEAFARRRQLLPDGREARRNLEAVLASYRSGRSGRLVRVNIPPPGAR